ncbi:hypothetical protein EPUS_07883 [Endocarpon pusillum Z07020]|uniref:BTB domain-containing protein n=1 Tax=Endocarpon pusillum (strain Z07020 / HMAS-L-300199) TaxID=1263415 RepID=U1HLQ6_ENDPU|nr:uncharacterized protein EPUS_07883 [Endocarpon pusillum Z07020]ERF71200.1 hypothetical protein EPUS_07883 [Endocarpon pusillum Z07020]
MPLHTFEPALAAPSKSVIPITLKDVDVDSFGAIVRWMYAPDKIELFKHQQREGSVNDEPLKDLNINCFPPVLLLTDRLVMKILIYDMCERLVDGFEMSLSWCTGRRDATAAEEAEAQAWAGDGKGADEDEVINEEEAGVDVEEEADEGEQVGEEKGARESCGLENILSGCLTSQTIFGTNAITESFIQSCTAPKKGFSAEMIELEPL